MFEEHDHQGGKKLYFRSFRYFSRFSEKMARNKKMRKKKCCFPSFLIIYYSAIFNVTILFLIHWCQEWKIEGNLIFTEKFKVS